VPLAPQRGCGLLLSCEHRARGLDRQLRAWPQVHARLAVVKGGGPPPAPRLATRASSVFWVTASAAPPRTLAAPATRTGYVVAPSTSPGAGAAFRVAGCDGRSLGAAGRPLALLVVLTATAAATIAVGLPARLLLPANWGELRGHLDTGIVALGEATYPYGGESQWSRLAILGAMPLWLGSAAALAFWP